MKIPTHLSVKKCNVGYVMLTVFFTFVLGIFPVLVGAPTTEGWYLVYSDMILNGMVPYRDFEIVLPPIYPYLIAGFTYLFGGSLLSFRLLGLGLLILFSITTYALFINLFSKAVSVLSSVLTVTIFASGNSAIFYDYHIFYIIFSELSFYFIFKFVKIQSSEPNNNLQWMLILSGIFAALTFFTRQPTGALMIVFCILIILIASRLKKIIQTVHYII